MKLVLLRYQKLMNKFYSARTKAKTVDYAIAYSALPLFCTNSLKRKIEHEQKQKALNN